MNHDTFTGLMNNAALLLALAVLYDAFPAAKGKRSRGYDIATGVMLGFIGTAVMLTPWRFTQGIIFDTRSVLLSMTGLFFGAVPTAIAALMTAALRIIQGGSGVFTGVAVLTTSAVLGLAWRQLLRSRKQTPRWHSFYGFGIIVQASMLLWVFSLPRSTAFGVLRVISLPVLLIYPIVTVLLGLLLTRQRQRSQWELELRQERDLLARISETSPAAIVTMDRDGRIDYTNARGEEILGLSRDQIARRTYNAPEWKITGPDGEPFPEEQLPFRRVQESKNIVRNVLHAVERKDGSRVLLSINAAPLMNPGGQMDGMVASIDDITERRKAEDSLRQSEQRFKQLLDSVNDYTYSVEIQNGLPVKTVHGYGCEKVTGFTPADYSANPRLWLDMAHPDDRKRVEHHADPLREGREVPELEHRIVHKNGSVLWIRNAYVIRRDAGGKVVGYEGLISDITERKQAETALRESEEAQRIFSERLAGTLEAINDLSKSETFDDLSRNAAVSAKRLMNFDRVGIWFFLPDRRTMQGSFGMDESGNLRDERGTRLPIVERHIQELVSSRKPIVLFEDEDLRDYQGNIVGRGSHVVAGLWNGGEIIGLLGADNLIRKHPILERDVRLLDLYAASLGHLFTLKRAEEQIRKDLKEKDVMLSEIHHRVKNNLNVITSLLSLQSDQITDKSRAMAAFEESKNRIYAMALVHESLYREKDFSSINMKSFAESMAQYLSQVYQPGAEIRFPIHDLFLDMNRAIPCGLILNELVTNALKHAFKDLSGGLIAIDFRMLNETACELSVQDDGIGLPAEIDVGESQSLGLLIVRQLIDQIDGVLTVIRGKGTRFQITFPITGT